jgi:monofunctional biosynthetic peptidoglycan transglycosylase
MRSRRGWAGRLVVIAMLAIAGWLAVEIWAWPSVRRLAVERPATTAFIEQYRALQRARGRPDRVAREWTPYAAISPAVKRAVLVAEDVNFFSHHGFALDEMQSALEDALRDRELPRGASTITQQLAKNLWLSRSRNPLRKAKEALLTWQLELGPGIYGVGAASQRYFGKPAADLDEREAAQLAAILPNPAAWRPGSASAAYQHRVAVIERRMGRAAFLWKQI